jgi:hypothetical protein
LIFLDIKCNILKNIFLIIIFKEIIKNVQDKTKYK